MALMVKIVRYFHGKAPLVRPKPILVDNIKNKFKNTVCKDVNWIEVAQSKV